MLASDEISVWWLATESIGAADLRRWLEILDNGERAQAGRFWVELDRREYIAAHALLRSMLTYYADQPPEAWRFATDEYGKPNFASRSGNPELQFNLAHTRGLVAAAITLRGDIGVDVEKIDRRKSDLAVAQAFFAPAELKLLQEVSEADWPTWFFRLWTLKEAYIKAIGTGVSTSLQSFAFAFDPIRITFAAGSGDHADHWHFTILPTTGQHILSVAAHRPSGGAVRVIPRAVTAQCF
jgi:4'-phosphopantetheinyl transferase